MWDFTVILTVEDNEIHIKCVCMYICMYMCVCVYMYVCRCTF